MFLAGLKTGGRTPWSYRSGTSFLHVCPGGIKLLFLLILSALPALGLPAAGAAAAFIVCCAVPSGIRPRELLAGSKPLLTALAPLAAVRALRTNPVSFDPRGLADGLVFSAGVLVSFSAASLFFSVTTMTELRRSLEAVELVFRPSSKSGPLRKRGRLSLALALMLGFLPRFFELWENAETSVKARACGGRIRRIIVILPLVIERTLETAAETAEALEARG
ncbi:MAG: energy-coupling factor transporter transmembrane protein EcfT, partial [Treponema sp.]|nr:energy-coupling factor transporter transmembrane protein EcfT [Treponema sp.]